MGIYSDGIVYGVCWNVYDNTGDFVKRYEYTQKEKLNEIQIREIKKEYDNLTEEYRKNMTISFYTCCTTTLDVNCSGNFMTWYPSTNALLEEFFSNGDIRI